MRASIAKRRGAWTIRFDEPPGVDGRRRQRRVTVRGTKKEAEAEAARLLSAVANGSYVSREKLKVSQYLDKWLATRERSLSFKTYERYCSIVSLHIKPVLGHVVLHELTPLLIEDAIATWRIASRKDHKLGTLSHKSVWHNFRVLSAALEQACRWGLLAQNPCAMTNAPTVPEKEMRSLSPTGVAQVVMAFSGSSLLNPVLVDIATGLRRGELLGLQWRDLDREHGWLNVERCLEERKQQILFKAPKTRKSRRRIALPQFACHVLDLQYKQQCKRFEDLGLARPTADTVIFDYFGEPWKPKDFSSRFYRAIHSGATEPLRFHDLRHSYASLLLYSGSNLKMISDALGHSTIKITADRYLHVLPTINEKAAEALDLLIGPVVRTLDDSPQLPLDLS